MQARLACGSMVLFFLFPTTFAQRANVVGKRRGSSALPEAKAALYLVICLNERPDSPAAAWYMMFFFTKILHNVQIFVKKDGIFHPAGGEMSFRVSDRVTRVNKTCKLYCCRRPDDPVPTAAAAAAPLCTDAEGPRQTSCLRMSYH
jgi:hypothetical protein